MKISFSNEYKNYLHEKKKAKVSQVRSNNNNKVHKR